MRLLHFLFLFVVFGGSWRHVRCTCVLESEFGFTLNCAFKKSGLFRVRNLGGVKAHVGLGFTVGDELGFSESLSNLEGNRRRATQNNKIQNILLAEAAQKNMNNKMSAQRVQTNNPSIISTTSKVLGIRDQDMRPSYAIPPFKPIPPAQERPVTSATDRVLTMTAINMTKPVAISNVPTPALIGIAVPAFQEMPASISRISTNQQKNNTLMPKLPSTLMNNNKQQTMMAMDKFNLENKINSNTVSKTSDEHLGNNYASFEYNPIRNTSAVANISMDAIEAAIIYRQQQLMKKNQQQVTTPATTTSTTQRAIITATISKRPITSSNSKVMNAPKEYYPVGYDKNFDDHFASKVELPETSFYCGEQKHFPGLYADEDLGCMVFHVCALTDDGLIMKSFLCPESTLFDQTILKCNWWFYTECKNSKKLYDSNIPISKSYQLMKALTFFSSYRKDQNSKDS